MASASQVWSRRQGCKVETCRNLPPMPGKPCSSFQCLLFIYCKGSISDCWSAAAYQLVINFRFWVYSYGYFLLGGNLGASWTCVMMSFLIPSAFRKYDPCKSWARKNSRCWLCKWLHRLSTLETYSYESSRKNSTPRLLLWNLEVRSRPAGFEWLGP